MHKNSTSTKDFRHGETVTMVQNKTKSIYRKKIFLVSGTRQQWAGNLYNKILRKHERTNPTTSTSRHHKLCCDSKRRRPAVSSSWSSRWCRSTHTHTRKRKKKTESNCMQWTERRRMLQHVYVALFRCAAFPKKAAVTWHPGGDRQRCPQPQLPPPRCPRPTSSYESC